ncbi:MAG: winged helix-turn-helix domain-containing protein [Anaerolineales bacterium]
MNEQLKDIVDIDRLVHEPARLAILAILWAAESADFLYLMNTINLTQGNLSSHLNRLEAAGYIEIEKTFVGKMPRTICRLTNVGKAAFEGYRQKMHALLGD